MIFDLEKIGSLMIAFTFDDRRRVVTNYPAYLRSPIWTFTALAAKERADWRCSRCCRKNRPLEVHHKTYDRLGRERPDDLVVLCEDCHARIHGRIRVRPQLPLPFDVEPEFPTTKVED